MNSIDIFIQNYFSLERTSSLTEFMYVVSSLFDFSFLFVLLIIFISVFIATFKGRKKHSILFLISVVFTIFIVYVFKYYFDIDRPANGVLDVFGQSFPSYHATMSTVFFIMLAYIFHDYLKTFGRAVLGIACFVSILLIATSRIYLGVHWLSDVFFGVVLGAAISYLLIFVFRRVINVQGVTSMLK